MVLSDFAYFAFIPIAIMIIIYVVIESIQKYLHRYVTKRNKIYIYGSIIATIMVIVIIILSLYIKI